MRARGVRVRPTSSAARSAAAAARQPPAPREMKNMLTQDYSDLYLRIGTGRIQKCPRKENVASDRNKAGHFMGIRQV